jgi:23S rRNA-/tRNA-specific pseudouridylate synthase
MEVEFADASSWNVDIAFDGVHFSEAGHPIIGDVKYGGKKADRMYLRSIRLTFKKKNSDEINCAVPALFLI